MTTYDHCRSCGALFPASDWCPNCDDDLVRCSCGEDYPELNNDGKLMERCPDCEIAAQEWAAELRRDELEEA